MYTRNCEQKATIGIVKTTLKILHRHNGIIPIKIKGHTIKGHMAYFIIDHLTGWLEAFPIPDKSADTIESTFINHYLPVHMCPRYILPDNGTELKNHLMDQVLQQLSIDYIFSPPYHPQSNRKLEVFHKYLKSTFKKLCKKDPTNWD